MLRQVQQALGGPSHQRVLPHLPNGGGAPTGESVLRDVVGLLSEVLLAKRQTFHAGGRVSRECVATDGPYRLLVPPAQLWPERGLPGGLSLLREGEGEESRRGGRALDPTHVRNVGTMRLHTAEGQLSGLMGPGVRDCLRSAVGLVGNRTVAL